MSEPSALQLNNCADDIKTTQTTLRKAASAYNEVDRLVVLRDGINNQTGAYKTTRDKMVAGLCSPLALALSAFGFHLCVKGFARLPTLLLAHASGFAAVFGFGCGVLGVKEYRFAHSPEAKELDLKLTHLTQPLRMARLSATSWIAQGNQMAARIGTSSISLFSSPEQQAAAKVRSAVSSLKAELQQAPEIKQDSF